MAGTPEEDLLGWLEREEIIHGFDEFDDAMSDIGKAQRLLYDELGYEVNDNQYQGLKDAIKLRYEELPNIGISYERTPQKWGFQDNFRDVATGRFQAKGDVFSLLATIR